MSCAECEAAWDLLAYQTQTLADQRRVIAKAQEDYETMKAQYDDVARRLDEANGILPY